MLAWDGRNFDGDIATSGTIGNRSDTQRCGRLREFSGGNQCHLTTSAVVPVTLETLALDRNDGIDRSLGLTVTRTDGNMSNDGVHRRSLYARVRGLR